jgi:hypothetical protein
MNGDIDDLPLPDADSTSGGAILGTALLTIIILHKIGQG